MTDTRAFFELNLKKILMLLAAGAMLAPPAHALQLDWSGQFRSEFHLIKNYTLDSSDGAKLPDPKRISGSGVNAVPNGYYIPGGGNTNATFESLFLKLQPKAVVNDNIYIKSEFWAGNPAYGLFGNAYPYTFDSKQFYSTQSRGSYITAQRLWGEFITDFGVVTIGRAPLNWGLGLFWSAGDGQWDRYESTGDQIRLTSKFGSFSFSPGIAVYSTGNAVGGACTFSTTSGTSLCTAGLGSGGVTDYFIQLKYESLEEDFDGGVNFVRRVAGGSPDPNAGAINPTTTQPVTPSATTPATPTAGGMAFNTWDLYAQKKLGKFRLAAEVPITSGQVGGVNYNTVAFATEADWRISDTWETLLRFGHAPGQPDTSSTTIDKYKAYYFNPNYTIGNIMFNYQFLNMSGFLGPNTLNNANANESNLRSPWDNPITNATYLSLGGMLHADKWTFNTGVVWAKANQTASASSTYFYNSWKNQFETNNANEDQGSSLGWEWDTGAAFQWDEFFNFRLDLGLYFPGDFYKFANTAGVDNATNTVFATDFRVGVNF